ncbi:nucleotidyltransferase family protein [Lentimicrobium sp.]|jgi:predicted nucleotidyltransferase|uniref:nucleotidyltransferase family protein n=1 Tax=Lentimicrobium sp. TaxID=2034841 RepID=UPI00345E4515
MKLSIAEIGKKAMPVLRRYGVHAASVVGSVARGQQSSGSDIDIVIDVTQPISLLTFARIKLELEEILDTKVDLIERSAIKSRIRKYLLEDEISLTA